MKKLYLILITIIFLPTMAISSKTLFEKQLKNDLTIRFNYTPDDDQHTWFVELITPKSVLKVDEFVYETKTLPIRKTFDVWIESIYLLFSLLDAIMITDTELLVLYDHFGTVQCKKYNLRTLTVVNTYPIKKFKMSFLYGYDAGYGKMFFINGLIYTYFTAAAPAREALIRFSLTTDATIEEIKFEEPDFTIPEAFSSIKKDQNELETEKIKQQLEKIIREKYEQEKPITYIGYVNDISARYGRLGIIYHFLFVDKQLKIYRYDIDKQHWMIGDFFTNEITE